MLNKEKGLLETFLWHYMYMYTCCNYSLRVEVSQLVYRYFNSSVTILKGIFLEKHSKRNVMHNL